MVALLAQLRTQRLMVALLACASGRRDLWSLSRDPYRGNPLAQLVPVASADDLADEETDGRSLSTGVPVGLRQSVGGETYSLGTACARRFSS